MNAIVCKSSPPICKSSGRFCKNRAIPSARIRPNQQTEQGYAGSRKRDKDPCLSTYWYVSSLVVGIHRGLTRILLGHQILADADLQEFARGILLEQSFPVQVKGGEGA